MWCSKASPPKKKCVLKNSIAVSPGEHDPITHPIDSRVRSFMQEMFCIAEQKEGLHQLMDERQDDVTVQPWRTPIMFACRPVRSADLSSASRCIVPSVHSYGLIQ